MTEKLRFYHDFVKLTTEQYEHCTLEEKLSVYVQHRPACIVPFLQELVDRVDELECEMGASRDEVDALRDEIGDLRDEKNHD